jgi:hypothetical protein
MVLGSVELGSVVLAGTACQGSAPAESKEPAANKPASTPSAPSPAAPSPAAQTAQPLKVAAEPTPAADAPKKGDAKEKAADKAPAAAPAAGEKQGAVVSEDAFSAWLQTTSPAKAGGPVQLEAVLVAKPPYHCNPEYPHKFKLNPAPAGLTYPEETVRGMKVTPERSVLAIPVNAQSAGKPTISGTLSFSVCTEERCMVEKRDLSVALDVM